MIFAGLAPEMRTIASLYIVHWRMHSKPLDLFSASAA